MRSPLTGWRRQPTRTRRWSSSGRPFWIMTRNTTGTGIACRFKKLMLCLTSKWLSQRCSEPGIEGLHALHQGVRGMLARAQDTVDESATAQTITHIPISAQRRVWRQPRDSSWPAPSLMVVLTRTNSTKHSSSTGIHPSESSTCLLQSYSSAVLSGRDLKEYRDHASWDNTHLHKCLF